MSNIVLQPNASGTGSITITTPNTNTDRTLNIPDVAGNLVTTGDTGTVSMGMLATSGSLPALDGSALTGNIGLTHFSEWKLTSDTVATSVTPFTAWANNTNLFKPNLGTLPTVSSGIFTLPVTGIWKIEFQNNIYKNGETRENICQIEGSNNSGSSYTALCSTQVHLAHGFEGSNVHASHHATCLVNITDISTSRIRFVGTGSQSVTWYTAGGSGTYSIARFYRLGDSY